MILLFSFLMYPVFFIISYVFGEYIYQTKNGAVLFAFLSAFVFSFLYYTIRTKVSQLTRKKKAKKEETYKKLTSLLLVSEKVFEAQFPKNALVDNSYTGVNEEKIISFLRRHDGELHIYSVKGITEGAINFLKMISRDFILHTDDEILNFAEKIIPEFEIKKEKIFSKIKNIFFTKEFRKFSIKYGVILLVLSLITPYKAYYILSGILLILFGIFQKFFKKISQQNQIPSPQF